jgi:HK97 family phage portal protein
LLGNAGNGHRLVTARTAENLSTVLACVNAISTAIASLPAYVYRRTANGREEDTAHPLSRLIRNGPNERQTWPDFAEWLTASTLLRGNGLAEIKTDGAGSVVALVPIPWDYVSVQMLPSGRLAYDVVETAGLFGSTGRPRRLLEGEVLHMRDRSDDGMVGRSRLSRAGAVIGAALGIQEFAGALIENGVNLSGTLSVDGVLTSDQYAALRDHLRATFSGPQNAAKAIILDRGAKWSPVSVSPEDAELLATRKFTVEELARLYGVPPPLVQDYSRNTFTNAETAGRWFAQFTLAPWLRKLETEFARAVFSGADRTTHELEIDMSGFMRGDYAARWAAHKIAVEADILSINEVREVEGFNPRSP